LANGGYFWRFASGTLFRATLLPGEFTQKPDFWMPETGFIRVFNDGPENFANGTLLLRSEGLLRGRGKTTGGKPTFRIGDPGGGGICSGVMREYLDEHDVQIVHDNDREGCGCWIFFRDTGIISDRDP